jgi:hypothetical protein
MIDEQHESDVAQHDMLLALQRRNIFMIKYGSSKQSEKVKKKLQEQVSHGKKPDSVHLGIQLFESYWY